MKKIKALISWFLKDKKRLIVGIVVIALIIFGLTKLLAKKNQKTQIQTATVEKGTLVSSVSASGQILSVGITNVNSKTSGIVKKVYVTDGEKVYKGKIIAEIDLDPQGQLNQAQAYASYLSAKSSLNSTEANYWSLQSSLFAANRKFINDAVARNLATDDPTYIQENADWKAAEIKFINNPTELEKSKASLNNAWLSYQETRSTIVSPTSGIIKSLTIAEGMNLSSSSDSSSTSTSQKIATIYSETTPLASFNISEIDITKIKTGQKATIVLDSIPDTTFTGKVVSIDRVGTVSNNVTNYPVIIKFDASSDQILSNMATTANIIIESKNDVLMVPSSAVTYQGDNAYVKIIKNKKEEDMPVSVGISSDTETEIISGLNEGDQVVSGTVGTGTTSTTTQRQDSGFFPMEGGAGRLMR